MTGVQTCALPISGWEVGHDKGKTVSHGGICMALWICPRGTSKQTVVDGFRLLLVSARLGVISASIVTSDLKDSQDALQRVLRPFLFVCLKT